MTFVLGDFERLRGQVRFLQRWQRVSDPQARIRMSQETEAARPERLRKEEEEEILAKVLTLPYLTLNGSK